MQQAVKVTFKRPVKPDEEAFKKSLSQIDQELKQMTEKIENIRVKEVRFRDIGGVKVRSKDIRHQLDEIREKQARLKLSKQKTVDQVKQMEEAMKNKINEVQAMKKKLPFKSVDELDRHISELEKAVDLGMLKLVDEKKYLSEISMLKRLRKSFMDLVFQQLSIDSDKKRIVEIKSTLEDPVSKALSEQYDKLKAEQNSLRQEQDNVYKSQKSLYEEKNLLSQRKNEIYERRKKLQDEYYSSLRKYQEYEREEKQKAWEKRKLQQDEYNREKRKQIADRILEEASMPAFLEEIYTCENLVRFLDPSAAISETHSLENSNLPQLNIRTVLETDENFGTVLKSKAEREDYFICCNEKKSKTNKRNKRPSSAYVNGTGNFNIDMNILQQFSFVNVTPPFNHSEIPSCIENLKQRMVWYKENQEKTVAERIEKAKKEIEELEAKALQQNQEKKHVQKKTNDISKKETADS
ncbi:hypothetical protein PNEG_02323 [Pneumocystis murina B123]|uniref:Nuclear segregation protein Bfr1 n=1 Tax=Pneumocystis murina (strain B123) TaxID=1069680 RepID=M7PFZ0_PNEMU|nr:hypothetical protein PNEG_02323 [Pneumocystis murina B123]EMR09374.1 hypothetical protein PNEG_02323 [Pneumocystis murina B123]